MRGPSARLVCVIAALAALIALAACTPPAVTDAPQKAPLLEPPAILHAGVLRVAVDAHYPPFASAEGSDVVGIDADVASALASQLGLAVEFVDVPASQLATALAEKRVDLALGGMPVTSAELSLVTVATSYLSDGPALFATVDSTVTAESLQGLRIAVQQDSPSYWSLRDSVGDERLVVVSTLREALVAVTAGKADAAAGDALVAGYIGREYPRVRLAGQLAEPSPLAVMVSKDSTATEMPLRDAMDRLAATGVLDAIRSKWLGGMPALASAAAAEPSAALDTSAPPVP